MELKSVDTNPQIKPLITWNDLRQYKRWEIIKELTLPLPWLVLSLVASSHGWYFIALFAAFYFFLTGLRVTHNAFHYCLGISKTATDIVMFILSILMLGSLHAVQHTHLRHHRHCLGEHDIEGAVAKLSFWGALIKGPLFPFQIHWAAWTSSRKKQKAWISLELASNIIWLALVWLVFDNLALKIHTVLMMVAYCLSAFFAVWTVHHDCDHTTWNNARTVRSRWKSLMFYNMFYHIEHHLYPQVPTCHMAELAHRIDQSGYCSHKKVI